MAETNGGVVRVTGGDDASLIRGLCKHYATAIEHIQMTGLNSALLTFKVLNRFSVHEIRAVFPETIDCGNIPGWTKVQKLLDSGPLSVTPIQ
jgi:hypothetical protein